MGADSAELRELSVNDGKDILKMINEIGPGENGFSNNGYDVDEEGFKDYLYHGLNVSKGIGLSPHWVPQTKYWLFIDGVPVGIGKVRHYLNDRLRNIGGHIGYCIRPAERGNGYGNIILAELLKKAAGFGIPKALVTCRESNEASKKVIEFNGGKYAGSFESERQYWFSLTSGKGPRELHIDDYNEVYELWTRARWIGLSGSDNLQGFIRYLLRNKGMSYCYEDEGKIVAAALCGHDGRRGYINHVVVSEQHKGKGIGRTIVEKCIFRLKEEGIDKCHILVIQENESGKGFWKAIGWTEREDLAVYSRFI